MNRKTLIRSMLLILVSGVLFGSILSFRDSDDPRIVKIINQIETLTNRNKFQKVYLKTDKDKYITGESVWIKAYLLSAVSLKANVQSNEIFVDLIGNNSSVCGSIILRNIDGIANGDIELNDSLPEGNYQLVAYTNWMRNFDDAYFFSKTIQIVNPNYNKYLTQGSFSNLKQSNKELRSGEKEKTVQFFPEGGYMVAGIPCRVAFKAINNLGIGVNVKGEIFDDSNTKICRFESKHLGMGAFNFTPEAGRKYYAKAIFDDETAEKIDLPSAEAKGYVMMVNPIAGDQIRLSIQSNIGNQMDEKNNEFILIGQSRGEIKYISKGTNRGKVSVVSIPKKSFPTGITQLTVFDGQGTAVCERLVFIHPKETNNKIALDVTKTNNVNEIEYKLQLKNSEGKSVAGNVALSVYENLNNDDIIWKENILSNLLLTSDLKGRVENASEYFNVNNQEAALDIDYVMMVNGWRRFVWKEIMAGHFSPLLYAASEGINPEEITSSTFKPAALNLSEKAYPVFINEQYDTKLIRKNTRESQKNTIVRSGEVSSNSIVVNHNTMNSYSDMIQYLKGRVAGVSVTDNGIIIRGVNSFNSGTDPLILQDNNQIGFSTLKLISPIDVSSVEVLKGPDASLYGARGANGVIIIHMRTASEDWNKINSKPAEPVHERIISFYKAREFYVPAYDAWNKKPSDFNVPRSVYWKPNIVIDSTGIAVVRFKNRGDVTNLKTNIEGITTDGSVLYYESNN